MGSAGRTAHQALEEIRWTWQGYQAVYDADLKGTLIRYHMSGCWRVCGCGWRTVGPSADRYVA